MRRRNSHRRRKAHQRRAITPTARHHCSGTASGGLPCRTPVKAPGEFCPHHRPRRRPGPPPPRPPRNARERYPWALYVYPLPSRDDPPTIPARYFATHAEADAARPPAPFTSVIANILTNSERAARYRRHVPGWTSTVKAMRALNNRGK